MSTTNLFVELIVIGIGAAAWAGLFLLAALGYDADLVARLARAPAAALPALTGVYLLGIVTDRLADTVLHALRVEGNRKVYFGTEENFLRTRGYVLMRAPYFATQFDYSRSRQRICRGWILNAVLIAIALNIVLLARPELRAPLGSFSAALTPAFLLLAAGCWFAWEKLAVTELKRIRDQAELLRGMGPPEEAG